MEHLRKIIFGILLLFGVIPSFAQTDLTNADSIPVIPTLTDTLSIVDTSMLDTSSLDETDELEEETHIHWEEDTLYWGHDSILLVRFYDKLKNLMDTKKGNLHIVQIGGSHVQAGTMTHCIRKHLLDDFGEPPASRGFIFPYSTASLCNNPYDYRIVKDQTFNLIRNVYQNHLFPLGASGIAVWNTDGLNSFTVKMNAKDYDFVADTVILLGQAHGWPIDPILKEDTIYHFPDSIDYDKGQYFYCFKQPIKDFTLYFPCSKGDTFVINGILLKNGRPGITVSSIGVNGAQTSSYLRCKNFTRDMNLLHPDLVIFNIGVNDAYGSNFDSVLFKNNYLKLVKQIREANPECAFIFVSNNDTWKRARRNRYTVNPTGPAVADVMYRLADLTGSAVWDQFSIMGGLKSMETWRRKGLAQHDRVHFTAAGYNLIGDLFYNAFIREIKTESE